jgi:CSLREA domain-containing protein
MRPHALLRLYRWAPLLLWTLATGPTLAATYDVTSLRDDTDVDGLCTLREAVALHNGLLEPNDCGAYDEAGDRIAFEVTGTIFLDAKLGELVLKAPALTIEGPAAAKLVLDGGQRMSVLVLDTEHPPALAIRAVTLANGRGSAAVKGWNPVGGGIRMNACGVVSLGPPTTIVVEDSVLRDNTLPHIPDNRVSLGAAIYSRGTLVLRRTLVQGNETDQGAVFHEGTAVIEDSEFNGNRGTSGSPALMLVSAGAPWTVRRSLFRNNTGTAEGAGAIDFFTLSSPALAAQALVENCTFYGNKTASGTVLAFRSDATVRSSTFHGNIAGDPALELGVIELYGTNVELTSNLFAANGAPEIHDAAQPGGSVRIGFNLFRSLVGDLPPSVPCASSTASGYNLCGVTSPGLGPLAENGGPTQTLALLPGSPAIDAGANPGALTTDQRGAGFARTAGARTDIGAYERPAGGSTGGSTPKQ